MALNKAKKISLRVIRGSSVVINMAILAGILIMMTFSVYAMWDSDQIYRSADATRYDIYRPKAGETASFEEFQAENPEVIAWLMVYGTNIDYPITQGTNNLKYVTTDAFGNYALSGAIFLDYRNDKTFADFNSILYGHHMNRDTMFGELSTFEDKVFFDERVYGNLFYEGVDYGLEFFAFIDDVDAYDRSIFTVNVKGQEQKQQYLDNLLANAVNIRNIGVMTSDRLLVLSTCDAAMTNGRDLLIARITDETYADPFEEERIISVIDRLISLPMWARILIPVVLLILIILVICTKNKKSNKNKKEGKKDDEGSHAK